MENALTYVFLWLINRCGVYALYKNIMEPLRYRYHPVNPGQP